MSQYASSILFSIDTALQCKGSVNSQTITDNMTIASYQSSSIQIVNNQAGAPKTCMLPAVKDGVFFWIVSSASSAQDINVNEPVGGSTLSTLTAGQAALVACDGTNWHQVIKA